MSKTSLLLGSFLLAFLIGGNSIAQAEQEINKAEALDIFGSLTDKAKWQYSEQLTQSNLYDWRLPKKGHHSLWSWACKFSREQEGLIVACPSAHSITVRPKPSQTTKGDTSLKFEISYFSNAPEIYGIDNGYYEFQITSRTKVELSIVEVWPEYDAGGGLIFPTLIARFQAEYTRK